MPPVSSSLQVPVGKSVSVPAPGALTSDTTASASSSGLVLPASYFIRDSIWADYSMRLCLSSRKGRGLWVFPGSWNYSGDPRHPQTSDVSFQTSPKTLRSLYHVKLRRPTLDHIPPQLHCHSTPLHTYGWGIRCARLTTLGKQHVSPVFVKLPFPAGQTLPPHQAESGNYYTCRGPILMAGVATLLILSVVYLALLYPWPS